MEYKPNQLYRLDDKIKDKVDCTDSVEAVREAPFIYLNGDVYVADYNMNHGEYLDEITDEETSDELYNCRISDGDGITQEEVSFGHILSGNVAVIDPITNYNVSNTDVIKALKKIGMQKIYVFLDQWGCELERVANQ